MFLVLAQDLGARPCTNPQLDSMKEEPHETIGPLSTVEREVGGKRAKAYDLTLFAADLTLKRGPGSLVSRNLRKVLRVTDKVMILLRQPSNA